MEDLGLYGSKAQNYNPFIFPIFHFIILGTQLNIPILFLVSIGCTTHVFLDCLNKSGVPLFLPITDKICVLTSRIYRIRSGAKEEIYFIISFVFIAYFFYNININGGMN